MTRRPRVLFAGGGTGGHLYPALALASAFQESDHGADVFFVGAKRGVEASVLPARGVDYTLLPFEPIRRSQVWKNWRLGPALVRVLIGLSRVFRDFSPDLVVGTGGYASGPVVAWGILRGIPTAVQEQNSYPGVTTRWLAPRVRQIYLAFPEALAHLRPGPNTEVFELGNPIAPPDPSLDLQHARDRFGLGSGPVALVVGGSQGARAVNEALLADLTRVAAGELQRPDDLQILWATGPANYHDVHTAVERLGVGWVHAEPYISDMPLALRVADVAVSRAGAMALAELCAWEIPSILIPLPHAAANHQHHNARALASAGAAVMIPESDLDSGRLWSELTTLVSDPSRRVEMAARAAERGHPNAAQKIVEKMAELIPA